jgi:hypothetical protein
MKTQPDPRRPRDSDFWGNSKENDSYSFPSSENPVFCESIDKGFLPTTTVPLPNEGLLCPVIYSHG